MVIGIDHLTIGCHRQKVVAMPDGLKRHEQSVERERGDGRERELWRREYRTGAARRERRNNQTEC